jgi:hypothetical protein
LYLRLEYQPRRQHNRVAGFDRTSEGVSVDPGADAG